MLSSSSEASPVRASAWTILQVALTRTSYRGPPADPSPAAEHGDAHRYRFREVGDAPLVVRGQVLDAPEVPQQVGLLVQRGLAPPRIRDEAGDGLLE